MEVRSRKYSRKTRHFWTGREWRTGRASKMLCLISDAGIFLYVPHKKGSQIASKQANCGEIFKSSHIIPLYEKRRILSVSGARKHRR